MESGASVRARCDSNSTHNLGGTPWSSKTERETHTPKKKNKKTTEYNIYSKEIFQEIEITDLPGIFICGIRYFSNTLLKQNGSLPFYLLSDMS